MTEEIAPCQTPGVITPNAHDRRREGPPPRRQRQPVPPVTPRHGDAGFAELPEPGNLPFIGIRVNVRV